MNIVVATSAPFYWQPQVECLAEAMRGRGHEARVATLHNLAQFRGSPCDVLFCLGTGESLQPILAAVPASAKILYLIESVPTGAESDAFTQGKLAVHRDGLREFDHVFVHTSRSVPPLQALGIKDPEVLVWPHFDSIYRPHPAVAQDIDVLFLGTVSPYRREVLQRAAKRCKIATAASVFHEKSAALYARAKIVLNIHYTPLRNFECRVIEVLGCGAFLLTEALDPEDLLRDGEHLAVFDRENLPDLLER